MKPPHKTLLPVLVLVFGVLATTALVAVRPRAAEAPPEMKPPLVRVVAVEPHPVRLDVHAQGNVEPRTESELVIEVPGRIVWVSPALDTGAFFSAGDVLARIDPREHEMARERAQAAVESALSRLSLARATLARRKSLERAGVGSTAALDESRSSERVAAADLRAARAALAHAELDLERTELKAPFDGRVREKRADVGQFAARGAPAARVYAVDYAEVRLPIPTDEMAFLDLPLGYRGEADSAGAGARLPGPVVTLVGRFAGREHRWQGRVVRTEGALDPRTRMVAAVARVENPYGRGDDPERPPLPMGLFVEALIEGRAFEGLIELPRSAVRGRDQVVVIDPESRMRVRRVDVLRADGERVFVSGGLVAGDRVCSSPLDVVVEGMPVRVAEAEPAPAADVARAEAADVARAEAADVARAEAADVARAEAAR